MNPYCSITLLLPGTPVIPIETAIFNCGVMLTGEFIKNSLLGTITRIYHYPLDMAILWRDTNFTQLATIFVSSACMSCFLIYNIVQKSCFTSGNWFPEIPNDEIDWVITGCPDVNELQNQLFWANHTYI